MSPFLALCLCLCCRPEHSDLSPATLMENHIPTTFKGKAPSGLVCKPPQIRGHQRCDSTSSCSYIQKTFFSRVLGFFFFFLFEGRFQYIVLAGLELQKSAYFCFLNAGIKVYIFDHQTSASTCKPCTRKEERFKGGREVQAGQTTNSLSS